MKLKNFLKCLHPVNFRRHNRNGKRQLTPATSEDLVELGHMLGVEFYTDPCRYVKGDYNTVILRNGKNVLFYVEVGDTFPTRFTFRLTSGKSKADSENEMVHYLWNNTTSLHTEHEVFRFPAHGSVEELRMRLSVMGTAMWSTTP